MATSTKDQLPADTVLLVRNYHCKECGKPPRIQDDSEQYTMYFRTGSRDQMLLQYDSKKNVGWLRSGDIGWETRFSIREDAFYAQGAIFGMAELNLIAAAYRMWTSRELKLPDYHELFKRIRKAGGN